jgi:hypothetical protein
VSDDATKLSTSTPNALALFSTTYTYKEQVLQISQGSNLQQLDYSYKSNGMLTGINNTAVLGNDLFAMALGYDTDIETLITGEVLLKNGNISAGSWRVAGQLKQAYRYKYDFLDRIKEAFYFESGKNNRYTSTYDYRDARGNFDKLTRMGLDGGSPVMIGDLQYSYYTNTNKISIVTDGGVQNPRPNKAADKAATLYTYDDNGAITFDPSRQVDITLNHLSLPQQIAIPDSNGYLSYIYDALGGYHGQVEYRNDEVTGSRHHVGSVEYLDDILDQVLTSQGFVELEYTVPTSIIRHNETVATTQQAINHQHRWYSQWQYWTSHLRTRTID